MKFEKSVMAGSLESSDALISLIPGDTCRVEIESIVIKQYGRRIRATAEEMMKERGVTAGTMKIQDRGALDCTLRARIKTALDRECLA